METRKWDIERSLRLHLVWSLPNYRDSSPFRNQGAAFQLRFGILARFFAATNRNCVVSSEPTCAAKPNVGPGSRVFSCSDRQRPRSRSSRCLMQRQRGCAFRWREYIAHNLGRKSSIFGAALAPMKRRQSRFIQIRRFVPFAIGADSRSRS